MSKPVPILPQTNNYNQLLDDCRAIIIECEFTSRWALVEGYHQLGLRILQEKSVTVTQLAQDLSRSERTIQCAVKFAKKFPDLQLLPEGKDISWHRIVNKYLPESTDRKEIHRCSICGGDLAAACHTEGNGKP